MTMRPGTSAKMMVLRSLEPISVGLRQENSVPEILDAAIHEFDELGYVDASISHIADRAGTSKSLITYHFPTKACLAASVVNLAYRGGVFMGAKRVEENPVDAIVWAAEHIATNVLHSPLARVALKLHDDRDLSAWKSPSKYCGWLARLADYLDEARTVHLVPDQTDSDAEARLLLSGVVGVIQVSLATGNDLSLIEDAVQVTRDRLQIISVGRDQQPLRSVD